MAARCARIRHTYLMNGGSETADMGTYWLSPTGVTIGALKTGSDSAINNYWTAVRGFLKTTATLAKIRIDEIDITTGHVVSGVDGALPFPNAGTNANNQLPLQVASVITLRTALSGGSYRGRVYFPASCANKADANGFMNGSDAQGLATGFAAYLHDVHVAGTDWESCVYSRKLHAMSPILSVDVGTVFDTQRNRRQQLVETRYSAAV